MPIHRRPRGRIIAAAIVMACLAVSACDKQPSNPEPSTSVSATPDTAAARRDVAARYDKWYSAYVKILKKGYDEATDSAVLKNYLVEPQLTTTTNDLAKLDRLNIVYRGRPTWTTDVTALNLDAQPSTAVLRSCLDLSKASPVDKTTGENLKPANELPRFVIQVSARRVNGAWYFTNLNSRRTTPC